ncbi:MAG: COX15/CtaA family protein, partial [Alphaproteobacteria bacterium]
MTATTSHDQRRQIAFWLLICCAMVFVMVVLGGVTRLTHSGLSMVEWQPVTGILPPLNDAEWQAAFERYQQYPEYQKLNRHMDVDGFKSIFWLEFIHRLWGHTIGVVFALPFLWFWWRGAIDRRLAPKLVFMFVLGGLQGLMGWYMVKSG